MRTSACEQGHQFTDRRVEHRRARDRYQLRHFIRGVLRPHGEETDVFDTSFAGAGHAVLTPEVHSQDHLPLAGVILVLAEVEIAPGGDLRAGTIDICFHHDLPGETQI
jgi:hypothetical protein